MLRQVLEEAPMSNTTTLKEKLKDWTDIDGAMYDVTVVLGLIDPEASPFATNAKHVFWSNHPVGSLAHKLLDEMTSLGILEKRDEPDFQYRWNAAFKGSWETPYQITTE